jgi:hypothetical protein
MMHLDSAILIVAFKRQANTRFAPTVVRKRASDVGARSEFCIRLDIR